MKKGIINTLLIGTLITTGVIGVTAKKATVKTDGYSKKQEKVVTVKQVVIKDKKITNRATVSNSENKTARDNIKKEVILQQKQLAKENKERMDRIARERKASKSTRLRKVR
ncbi:MAG: hypothetical protein PHX21_12775 [bacterium]|nr:hypothetical protein [bacterium]